MAHILSIANQKGGVGKTTSTFNLARALSKRGSRVLIIDNDPQANLTSYAVDGLPDSAVTIDQIYLAKTARPVGLSDITNVAERLDLLPADTMLSGVEYYLVSRTGRETVLKAALEKVKSEFDFIFIDNPPSLNLLTVNGLVASDKVLVPVQPEFFSLEGLSQLQSTIDDLKKWHPTVQIFGLFTNMFDERRKLNQDVFKTLEDTYGSLLFRTRIHNSVKIAESSGFGKSVIDYAPKSKSAQEFLALAEEIVTGLTI